MYLLTYFCFRAIDGLDCVGNVGHLAGECTSAFRFDFDLFHHTGDHLGPGFGRLGGKDEENS